MTCIYTRCTIVLMTVLQVAQLPEKDELSWSKMQLTARMDVAMGGRVAEEIIFGPDNITSGKECLSVGEGGMWERGRGREGERRRNTSTWFWC